MINTGDNQRFFGDFRVYKMGTLDILSPKHHSIIILKHFNAERNAFKRRVLNALI